MKKETMLLTGMMTKEMTKIVLEIVMKMVMEGVKKTLHLFWRSWSPPKSCLLVP